MCIRDSFCSMNYVVDCKGLRKSNSYVNIHICLFKSKKNETTVNVSIILFFCFFNSRVPGHPETRLSGSSYLLLRGKIWNAPIFSGRKHVGMGILILDSTSLILFGPPPQTNVCYVPGYGHKKK